MTEKEFLKLFGDSLQEPDVCFDNRMDRRIDEFLEEQHKEYYEVEFIKKDATQFYGIPLIFDPQLQEDSVYLVKDNKVLGVIKDIDFK